MKHTMKLGLLAALTVTLAGCEGCLTQKQITPVTTTGTNGVVTTTYTTNTVVNTNVLAIECGVVTEACAGASAYFGANTNDLPILVDIQTGLGGIINGTNPQTVSQVLQLVGLSGNEAAVNALTPLINQVSAFEQLLLAHYSGANGVIITTAFAKAVLAGLNLGLPPDVARQAAKMAATPATK